MPAGGCCVASPVHRSAGLADVGGRAGRSVAVVVHRLAGGSGTLGWSWCRAGGASLVGRIALCRLRSEWARFMFDKPSALRAIAVGAVLLALAACSHGNAAHTEVSDSAQPTQAPDAAPTPTQAPVAAATPDFATVSKLMNDAIAAHRLPGAVVVIGHGGKVVFHQAYGSRASLPASRARWIACTCRADDRGHDLRHGVVDEAPRNGHCRHAALRTRQGPVRRSRAAVSPDFNPANDTTW